MLPTTSTDTASASAMLGVAAAASSGINGGSSAVIPQPPPMFTGGNLVNSVNASYQNTWAQLQTNYANASDALAAVQAQITRKQNDLQDAQSKWTYYNDIVKLWQGRHSGCGPKVFGYDYSCSECDDQVAGNTNNRDGAQANIDAANAAINTLQGQITSYLAPQLADANKQLQASYTAYGVAIKNAQQQEAAAAKSQADTAAQNQNTALQSNPEYVAAQNAAKAAAAAAELATQKEANKEKLVKYGVIAAVVVIVGVLIVVALKIMRK